MAIFDNLCETFPDDNCVLITRDILAEVKKYMCVWHEYTCGESVHLGEYLHSYYFKKWSNCLGVVMIKLIWLLSVLQLNYLPLCCSGAVFDLIVPDCPSYNAPGAQRYCTYCLYPGVWQLV